MEAWTYFLDCAGKFQLKNIDLNTLPGKVGFECCSWREGNGNPLQNSCLESPMDGEPGGSTGSQTVGPNYWLSRHIDSPEERCKSVISSVQFSHSVVSDSLPPHESQHARPPCLSQTPGVYSNSCPSSRWCHPAILSSVIPFSSCPQSLPASGSFPMSQLFASGGQSIGVSASALVLPMNTQDWSPLGWTGWISLQSKGLSRVFSNTIIQKHQFFGAQLSSQSDSHINT